MLQEGSIFPCWFVLDHNLRCVMPTDIPSIEGRNSSFCSVLKKDVSRELQQPTIFVVGFDHTVMYIYIHTNIYI